MCRMRRILTRVGERGLGIVREFEFESGSLVVLACSSLLLELGEGDGFAEVFADGEPAGDAAAKVIGMAHLEEGCAS